MLAIQETSASRQTPLAASTADQNQLAQSSDSSPVSPAPSLSSYQPSQAETLAAHIFAYVSSASALGISLSKPITQTGEGSNATALNGYGTYGNGMSTPQEERDADTADRDEDEVKLLRMRTRKHEIVVVPDRKYLLCVVHDAAHASTGAGAGAGAARTR
jgi:hypothetical protein